MSSRTTSWSQSLYMAAVFDPPKLEQQSRSTYMSGGGRHPGEPVPFHETSRHGEQALALTGSEDTDEDLPMLVTDVGNPGGCVCSGTRKLFSHLETNTQRQKGKDII